MGLVLIVGLVVKVELVIKVGIVVKVELIVRVNPIPNGEASRAYRRRGRGLRVGIVVAAGFVRRMGLAG